MFNLKERMAAYSSHSDEELQEVLKKIRSERKHHNEEINKLVLEDHFVICEMHKRGIEPHKPKSILDKPTKDDA